VPGHFDTLSKATAAVAGLEVALAVALDEAASLIRAARTPLFLLACDTDAAAAALDLAEFCGAIVDATESEAMAVEVGALRGPGGFIISRREALARADVLLLAGASAEALDVARWGAARLPCPLERKVLKLNELSAGRGGTAITSQLSALATLVKGEGPALAQPRFDPFRAYADALLAAEYGVVLWSPSDLDALDVAALSNLVSVLNQRTRFSSLPLRARGNGWGVNQLMLARWGVPLPARHVEGVAVHDPWLYSAPRMIRDGEVDLVLTVSNLSERREVPQGTAPIISIGAAHSGVRVSIASGVAGVDHAGDWYDEAADAIIAHRARQPSATPSAAHILRELAFRLKGLAT
jgi:formylmethanofuran dehydrogenase subunit B